MTVKRCTRCILPETYPNIVFNQKGICNTCLSYKKTEPLGMEKLKELFVASTGRKYDCLVPISGGRDSAFVLYAARKILNLNVLAISYDNEFRAEQASVNMRKACETLGVDFISFRSARNIATKIVASHLMASIPYGPGPIQHRLCFQCWNGAKSVVYRTAIKENIPVILWGFSKPEELSFREQRREYLGYITPMKQLLSPQMFYCLKWVYYLLLQRMEFHVPGNGLLDIRQPILNRRDIKEVCLFDYIEWDRREIKKVIMKDLGWDKPKNSGSTWRFDCHLHTLVNYCYRKSIGFNHNLDGYANMVRFGKMSRETALRQVDMEEKEDLTDKVVFILEERLRLPKDMIAKCLSY